MSEQTLEGRVEDLEKAVKQLRRAFKTSQRDPQWLQRFQGAFSDEPAFDEVIALGREIRSGERPVDPE